MEFLIFKNCRDNFTESREDAIGILQKAEKVIRKIHIYFKIDTTPTR